MGVSDIPVGSPPAPPGRHAAPGGWYPDPVDPAQERYWDGWQWSRTTRAPDRPPSGRPPSQPAWTAERGAVPPQPPYPTQPPYPPRAPYQSQAQPGTPYGRPVAGRRPVLTADGVPVSGWWWRVLAMGIDTVIVYVLVGIAAAPILSRMFAAISTWYGQALRAAQAGQPMPPQPSATDLIPAGDQLVLSAVTAAVGLIYFVAFLRWKGATPGKLICGLRVVPVDEGRNRAPLAWGSVIVRAAVWVLPGVAAYLFLVQVADVLLPLWHPKRQALHDLAARTQVVKIN